MYNQYRATINEDDYQHKEDKDQSPEHVQGKCVTYKYNQQYI